MTTEEEETYYKKAYLREKKARKEAERILEAKAAELYRVNKELLFLNVNLEQNLFERTEEIKEAEEQYRHLVENANDFIFKTNLQGNFTYVNDITSKISGYDSNALIEKNFTTFVHPDFKKEMLQLYNKQLQNEEASTYIEYKLITKSKKEIWLGQNTQLLFKDGFPIGFLAVARDITDRVKINSNLKQSQEKYKKLFEGLFDGVARLDNEGNLLEWNKQLETMLGYDENVLLNRSIFSIVHPDDIENYKAHRETLKNKGYYTNYIGRLITNSGKAINVEINATITNDNGEITGSIDNIRDISERVALEKAIIRSEEKYRGIIENLEFGLLEVDVTGIITKAYPSFCKLTGYDENDLIGEDPYSLLHPDFHEVMNEKTSIREAGIADVYEVKIKQKNGNYKWVIISGAPFYNEKGDFSGSIGVHLDISRQKEMEMELKSANQIALASSKAKELFLANMSHEIRTPLNAVIGLSNLLKKTLLNNVQSKYVTNIDNASKNLLLLVNDILDISKIESGKTEINYGAFALDKAMRKIISSVSYLAEQKSLYLKLHIDENLDKFYLGDELKLCQILINLTNNAIKFTDIGGVDIKIEKIAEKNNEHQVKISVKDTGKGIAREALTSIFDDFTQEDNTISKKYGGTGLGLSISNKMVALLDGKLNVTSEINKGTTFHFSIWLKITKQHKELVAAESVVIDWSKINILTVEDNKVNQFVIESTITSWNGNTDIANHGEEALAMLASKTYDIILMDMQMPIMDGITATKKIRNELELDIPIIALTANALKKEREKCLEVGMNAYIGKPFDEEILQQKMIALLTKSTSKRGNPEHYIGANEPFFTTERLKKLSRNNDAFVKKLLGIFIEDGTTQLKQFKASNSPDEKSRIVHKMKPSIDYISNEAFKTLLRKVEAQDFLEQPELLTAFTENLTLLIQAAKQHIEG